MSVQLYLFDLSMETNPACLHPTPRRWREYSSWMYIFIGFLVDAGARSSRYWLYHFSIMAWFKA
jgi:hypothetical protein